MGKTLKAPNRDMMTARGFKKQDRRRVLRDEDKSFNKPFLVRFEVASLGCELECGEKVIPETVIGIDKETNAPITADCYGDITEIISLTKRQSLRITVTAWEVPEKTTDSLRKGALKSKNKASSQYNDPPDDSM